MSRESLIRIVNQSAALSDAANECFQWQGGSSRDYFRPTIILILVPHEENPEISANANLRGKIRTSILGNGFFFLNYLFESGRPVNRVIE